MKKKSLIIGGAAALVLIAIVTVSQLGLGKKAGDEYPQIAYIDDVTYQGTGEKCEAVPRMMPEGTIETFVSEEIMPDAYNSANFGAEYGSLEYMFLEEGELIIHVGEDWFYFEKVSE